MLRLAIFDMNLNWIVFLILRPGLTKQNLAAQKDLFLPQITPI